MAFKFRSREELAAMSHTARYEYFQQITEALKRNEEELDAALDEAEKILQAARRDRGSRTPKQSSTQ